MQKPLILGLVLSLTAVACAPVASSVPKLSRQRPAGDVVENDKFSLRMNKELILKSESEFSDYEKTIPSDFEAYKFAEREPEAELIESRGVKAMSFPANLNQIDIRVVFVMKSGSKVKASDVNLDWLRDEENKISFSISKDGMSEATSSALKKNLTQIAVYYRAAKL